ncbi:MAG: FecR domain-containing protein [Halomonas sp.]
MGDSAAIEAAAGWMARLLADDATEQDRLDCLRWREQHPQHEKAWQRMCQVSGKFDAVSAGTAGGAGVLEKAHRAVMSRRRFLELSALAGVSVTATWLVATRTQLGRGLLAQYRTGVGETRTFTLEDGTRLLLNTDSAVDVAFTSQERRIHLHQGEILIHTGEESPRRDFVVETRFGQLKALGTSFNVRQCEHHAQVAVLEGDVEARAAGGGLPQPVGAGQQARFDATRAEVPEPLQPSDVSWRDSKLVAQGMRVADFVEEIGRYRPGFTLHDAAVADLTISGVFSTQDTDRALQSLADSLPVALEYRTAYWVKVKPAAPL